MLSDRRLTSDGRVEDEEHGKTGTLQCADARLAFGFAGIARAGSFTTRRWLIEALIEAGPPDHGARGITERFSRIATRDFERHPVLSRLAPAEKRLVILLSGYLYYPPTPMVATAVISNFINQGTKTVTPESWPEFVVTQIGEGPVLRPDYRSIYRTGVHAALTPDQARPLEPLLAARKPAKAIIGKATEIMLAAADTPGSHGTIGKQITWIRVPADPNEAVESGYYSSTVSRATYMPCTVWTTPDTVAAFDGGRMEITGLDSRSSLSVPKVGRNAACPCGSGIKYKRCHGTGRSHPPLRRSGLAGDHTK